MMSMGGSSAPAGQPNVLRRNRPEDAAQHITVSDPVQHQDGINKYTSYRVDVRAPADAANNNMGQPFSAVLRRYSDFLWLYEKLQSERAGAIVPPLPEKQPVGRFSPAFVEERRMQLERFLRRVAVHPELSDAKCVEIFLRADDVTFQAAKHSKDSPVNMANSSMYTPAPVKKEGFKRWFAETKTSISGDLVRSPDDELFEEINRYIHGLDTQMKNVSNQASGLVRKGKEIANGLFEFGLAFNLLGQSEADALGDSLSKMGETADKLSVLSAEHAEQELRQFEEPLQDYIKMIHGVKLALQRRHEKRLTYSTCLSEVETKQAQLAKLRAQIGMEAKAYGTEMSLRRSLEASEAARDDFATVSQRVLREVDRFKREKAEDMRRTVLDYIQLQVEYNKRMEQAWAALIPQLERVQLDQNSNAVVAGSPGDANNGSQPVPQTPVMNPAPQQYSNTMPIQNQQQQQQQPMMPNPQQAMQQPAMQANPYMGQSMQQGAGNFSVQYRDAPPGSL